jgi:tetratricopeptide (TPR) repeat protein
VAGPSRILTGFPFTETQTYSIGSIIPQKSARQYFLLSSQSSAGESARLSCAKLFCEVIAVRKDLEDWLRGNRTLLPAASGSTRRAFVVPDDAGARSLPVAILLDFPVIPAEESPEVLSTELEGPSVETPLIVIPSITEDTLITEDISTIEETLTEDASIEEIIEETSTEDTQIECYSIESPPIEISPIENFPIEMIEDARPAEPEDAGFTEALPEEPTEPSEAEITALSDLPDTYDISEPEAPEEEAAEADGAAESVYAEEERELLSESDSAETVQEPIEFELASEEIELEKPEIPSSSPSPALSTPPPVPGAAIWDDGERRFEERLRRVEQTRRKSPSRRWYSKLRAEYAGFVAAGMIALIVFGTIFLTLNHLRRNSYGFLMKSAEKFYINERYEDSLKAYREVSLMYPDRIEPFLGVARASEQTGRIEEAIEAYKRVLDLEPFFDFARGELERVSSGPEELEEAHAMADAGSREYDDVARMGKIALLAGEYGDALLHFSDALAIYSGDAGVWVGFADAQNGLGSADEAVKSLKTALLLDPANAEVKAKLADIEKAAAGSEVDKGGAKNKSSKGKKRKSN